MHNEAAPTLRFFQDLQFTLSHYDEAFIGVVGGKSVTPLYRDLALNWPLEVDLKKVQFYLADERMTDLVQELNLTQLNEILFHPLKKTTGKTPRVCTPQEPGKFPFPRSDLLILSAGDDGHVCSLFPHHPLLQEKNWEYLEIIDAPKAPPRRLTISPLIIQKTFSVILFIAGIEKQPVLEKFTDPSCSTEELPAKFALKISDDQHRLVVS